MHIESTHSCIVVTLCVIACVHRAALAAAPPATSPTPAPTTTSGTSAEFDLTPLPPVGWQPDPLRHTPKSIQQVWISPTRTTAYGLVRFALPVPVGPGFALRGFISAATRQEGPTKLLSSEAHRPSGGIQFTADLPLYRLRGILWTRGLAAWVVYASTDRRVPTEEQDLAAALTARDATAPHSKAK